MNYCEICKICVDNMRMMHNIIHVSIERRRVAHGKWKRVNQRKEKTKHRYP